MSLLDHPSASQPEPSPILTVRPWWDPQLAIEGHSLNSEYTERFWLGVLGPSVICVLRRFARGFETHPGGFQISVPDTAKAIGLGAGTGKQAPFNRTIERCCTFSVARRAAPDVLEVRLHLPTLTTRQLSRLPLSVRTSHSRWLEQNPSAAFEPNGPIAA